jgi:hypothetical protein
MSQLLRWMMVVVMMMAMMTPHLIALSLILLR